MPVLKMGLHACMGSADGERQKQCMSSGLCQSSFGLYFVVVSNGAKRLVVLENSRERTALKSDYEVDDLRWALSSG